MHRQRSRVGTSKTNGRVTIGRCLYSESPLQGRPYSITPIAIGDIHRILLKSTILKKMPLVDSNLPLTLTHKHSEEAGPQL